MIDQIGEFLVEMNLGECCYYCDSCECDFPDPLERKWPCKGKLNDRPIWCPLRAVESIRVDGKQLL